MRFGGGSGHGWWRGTGILAGGQLARGSPAPWVTLALVVWPGIAGADVQAVLQDGVPNLPIPTYQETGLPDFTMPVGTPTFGDGTAVPSAGGGDQAGGSPVGAGGGSVAQNWDAYAGQIVGSGECVALLQAASPSVGLTATWTQGAQVQGNTALVPGTVIATFNAQGHYANTEDGSSHAAIYLGQNAQGIQVMDQWANHSASYRTIPWTNPSGLAADTGSAFHVVTH